MKFAVKWNILLVLMVIIMNNNSYAQVILRFQTQITTAANRLGDLIQITNDSQKWANLSLQSRPVAGQLIGQAEIIDWMHQLIGDFNWEWQGKKQTRVRKPHKKSEANALINKAEQALSQRLNQQYSRVEIKALTLPKDSEFLLDSFKVEMDITYPVTKRVCVWLINEQKRIAIWFSVNAYTTVMVANHDLPSHTPLTKESLAVEERNIAGLNDKPAVLTFSKTVWLQNALQKNQIVLENHLTEPASVIHGQPVKVSIILNSPA